MEVLLSWVFSWLGAIPPTVNKKWGSSAGGLWGQL